jgi:predicted PurR-regulated permease PerM
VEEEYQLIVEKGPKWVETVINNPLVAKIIGSDIDWKEKAGEGAKVVSSFIIKAIGKTSKGTFQTILMSFIMLYTLFFFLIDGPALMQRIKYLSPIKDEYEEQIIDKFVSITRATVKGTIIIGLIQGTIGGVTFAIFGVGSSIFWGTLMVILSIIPGIGSAIIWIPALIIKMVTGHIGQGIGILIGGIIISVSDNILRPILVGKDTKMHELMILFSTLGGIVLFGIVGFILGPILAAVFVTVTEIYASEYQEELENNKKFEDHA